MEFSSNRNSNRTFYHLKIKLGTILLVTRKICILAPNRHHKIPPLDSITKLEALTSGVNCRHSFFHILI
jgi:hypothetical protein